MFKKKKKEESKPIIKGNYKQKAIGLIIGLVAGFLLLLVIFFVVSRLFRPEDLSNFLPKDTTIAFAQVSVNPGFDQVEQFYQALSKYEIYHPQSIVKLINETLDTDFLTDIEPWIGRQIGFAFLEKKASPGEFETVFFAEFKDKNKTLDFMKSRGLKTQEDYILNEDYLGTPIYRYALSQTFTFTFVNSYIVIAPNNDLLKSIIEVSKGSQAKLKDSPLYQKVAQNVPIKSLIFSYIDFEKLMSLIATNSNFMSEKGRDLLAFQPFLKLYKGFGIAMVMQQNNLALQTYISLDGEYLKGKNFLNFDAKFRGNLLKLLPKDLLFYAGGFDLQKQIQRYSEIFSSGGEVSYLIFEGLLNAQKNTYLGNEISLDEDVYPLLQGEYAFAITKLGEDEAITVLLELQDPLRDHDKIAAIADSFIRKSAILAPKVVEIALDDGTIAKEIQTTPEEINKTVENYSGYEINCLNISNQSWGIYYIILDKNLVISSKKDQLKRTIDLMADSKESALSSDIYKDAIQPVLNVSDEIMYINSDFLLKVYKDSIPVWFNTYFAPFKSFSTGNNYFQDGISSINYIKID